MSYFGEDGHSRREEGSDNLLIIPEIHSCSSIAQRQSLRSPLGTRDSRPRLPARSNLRFVNQVEENQKLMNPNQNFDISEMLTFGTNGNKLDRDNRRKDEGKDGLGQHHVEELGSERDGGSSHSLNLVE